MRKRSPGKVITTGLNEDVLRMIIDHVAILLEHGFLTLRDVVSLAQSSKDLHLLAVPIVYRTIVLDCPINKAVYEQAWLCCSNLAKHPHLASLVRTCIIRDSFDFWDGLDHFPNQWKTVVFTAVTNMRNLRELRWSCASFTQAFWSVLCSLEHLETLYLARCSLNSFRGPFRWRGSRNTSGNMDRGSDRRSSLVCPPKLSDLTLIRVNAAHGDDAPLLDMLDELQVSNALLGLVVDRLPILRQLTSHLKADSLQLRRIWLSDSGDGLVTVEHAYEILQACPTLTEVGLSLHEVNSEAMRMDLSKSALPDLRIFAGDHWLANRIVPDRPIRKVLLDAIQSEDPIAPVRYYPDSNITFESVRQTFEFLHRSSEDLLHLEFLLPEVGSPSLSTTHIPTYFPWLRLLRIHFPPRIIVNEKNVGDIVPILEQLKYLEDFACLGTGSHLYVRTSYVVNLFRQHELVVKCGAVRPTLSSLQVSSLVKWSKDSSEWTPVLTNAGALRELDHAATMLESASGSLGTYDWNGCIADWLRLERSKKQQQIHRTGVIGQLNTIVRRLSRASSRDSSMRDSELA